MTELLTYLADQGILGAVASGALFGAYRLYQDGRARDEKHSKEIRRLNEQNSADLKESQKALIAVNKEHHATVDRLETLFETQMRKN